MDKIKKLNNLSFSQSQILTQLYRILVDTDWLSL